MRNLSACIRTEIENGRLNPIFTAQDIKDLNPRGADSFLVAGKAFKGSAIGTNLANFSIGPGDRLGAQVKRGLAPWFLKLGERRDGRYTLIDDDPDELENVLVPDNSDESSELVEFDDETVTSPLEPDCSRIAKDFVEHLRNKPFRILLNKARKWYPESGALLGWENRLAAYFWANKKWIETKDVIQTFTNELSSIRRTFNPAKASDQNQIYAIYEDIRKWGNPNGTQYNGHFLASRLYELWSTGETISQVDSTLTKLYAFADPWEFVIYDSRVAAAILSIAEDIYRYKTIDKVRQETVDQQFARCFPALGRYAGAGGTRPRGFRWQGWPNAYKSVKAQHDANKLCKQIVSCLNVSGEDGRSNWTLREVEAILFMEGY